MNIPNPRDVGASYPTKLSEEQRYEQAQRAVNQHIRNIITQIVAFLRDPSFTRPHMALSGAPFYTFNHEGWPAIRLTSDNCTKEIVRGVAEAMANAGWNAAWGPKWGSRTTPWCIIILPKDKYGHILSW